MTLLLQGFGSVRLHFRLFNCQKVMLKRFATYFRSTFLISDSTSPIKQHESSSSFDLGSIKECTDYVVKLFKSLDLSKSGDTDYIPAIFTTKFADSLVKPLCIHIGVYFLRVQFLVYGSQPLYQKFTEKTTGLKLKITGPFLSHASSPKF